MVGFIDDAAASCCEDFVFSEVGNPPAGIVEIASDGIAETRIFCFVDMVFVPRIGAFGTAFVLTFLLLAPTLLISPGAGSLCIASFIGSFTMLAI